MRNSQLLGWLAKCFAIVVLSSTLGVITPARASGPFADWNRDLQEAIHDLESGDAKVADKVLRRLVDDYVREVVPGEASERNLGTLLLYRAIAERELGRIDDAHWNWDLAANFLPDISTFDLGRFWLNRLLVSKDVKQAPWKLQPGSLRVGGNSDSDPTAEALLLEHHADTGHVPSPPQIVRRTPFRFRLAAGAPETPGKLVVRVTIDAKGRISQPVVVEKLGNPALSYSALESIRKWVFRPATLDGRPVTVFYTATIDLHNLR